MNKPSKSEVLKSFLLAVRAQFFVFFGTIGIFGLVFVLGRLPFDLFLYCTELAAFFFLAYLIVQYIRFNKRYLLLQSLQTVSASNIKEVAENADPAERLYIEKLEELLLDLRELENLHKDRQADQLDYFTLWLHQIKTPISAISLLNQSSQAKEAKQISQELVRLEDYTHMALNYIKLEEPGAEMDLAEVDLDDIIKKAIKKYSILFIYKGIKLDYEPLGIRALSDGKWLQNLLEQILSNSLKYTPHGTISIFKDPKNAHVLVIEDTGLGIRTEDLPKVFNKGYSGLNGRLHEKSTGLGLFLSKKICQRLGHTLDIQSEFGRGTRVSIDMSRKELAVFD
ncbi:HAMP domain-containing sensor histidine kinase [Planomicrobium sp. CPCC 101079]|uniref:sensor histidine kinase n=1 Tax=Planomicrobium sp. CPCC 101079 TaxID=2599618 RepID=UPI0011B56D73|nr:sensor histidine kinase [Planomicrobium sp. CPCC 101079]TWT01489.1 HAMP domain-containing histidine kinase [Planomicrobium sp. CPCC 101079]